MLNVQIPFGSVVASSRLRLVAAIEDTSAARIVIRAELNATPDDFSEGNTAPSLRPQTAEYTDWVPVPWTTVGGIYYTFDLSGVVQSVIDLPAWVSGNPISFIMQGTGYREFHSEFAGDTNLFPTLEYTFA